MPIAGERPKRQGMGYLADPIAEFASEFSNTTRALLTEAGVDYYSRIQETLMNEGAVETLRNYFVENSADEAGMSAHEIKDHRAMMMEQFENDKEGILNEYAAMNNYNPVIGMSLPIHKNILMNTVFDKGAIQKAVALSPKFTMSLEKRILTDVDGNEIDMWKEQTKIKDVMAKTAPVKVVEIALPEVGTTDILAAIGATTKDSLSIDTYISGVQVEITTATGTEDAWVPVQMRFKPSYGPIDRILMEGLNVVPAGHTGAAIIDQIHGSMAGNRIIVTAAFGKVKAIQLSAKKDTSNGLSATPTVSWRVTTDIVEIGNANPINVPISPEETKDIAALYQVDQLSKIMAMIKDVLSNDKDDRIKDDLDTSFATMDPSQKRSWTFDMAPRDGYDLDHVTWRQATFFDALDTYVTDLLQILRDPNVVVSIIGRTDLIRKIKPTTYSYQTPASIGPVKLEYERTVTADDASRVYQFLSSQKMNGSDELIITLKPNNSDRIIYRIYDYQLYISNEIRNANNPTLPAVHAFERWKFVEYQPVQARINILNPTGLK